VFVTETCQAPRGLKRRWTEEDDALADTEEEDDVIAVEEDGRGGVIMLQRSSVSMWQHCKVMLSFAVCVWGVTLLRRSNVIIVN
jgi:hypothetical protein